jgi:hypothetical protein
MTLRTRDVPGDLLAQLLESPDLARAVQGLEPAVLHALVRHYGLEDCGPIVALATTEQLVRVFDHDLWRGEKAGGEERFDADRFGLWVEVLMEAGVEVAAGKVASLDFDFVTAALVRHALVLDASVLDLGRVVADVFEADELAEALQDRVESALETGVSVEVGGHLVVARRAESWDALLAVLMALEADHHAFFARLMARCRALSTEYIEDNGGLYDVLTTEEQVFSDVAADRGERRDEEGYVDPPLAVAFLDLARQPVAHAEAPPCRDHVTARYFRLFDRRAKERAERATADPEDATRADPATPEIRRLVAVLQEAGVLPVARPPLLAGASGGRDRISRIRAHMVRAGEADPAAHARQAAELGYLANVLVAGCSFQSRRFRPVEAADAALAVCNLGLENWPARWPEARDLVTVFRVGWGVLHERVGLPVARGLAEAVTHLKTPDAVLRGELTALRRRIEAHLKTGRPWRMRDGLDVVAVLDTPSWASLRGLLDECPVVPRQVEGPAGPGPRTVTNEFDFISENEQVAWVEGFVLSLPERLRG